MLDRLAAQLFHQLERVIDQVRDVLVRRQPFDDRCQSVLLVQLSMPVGRRLSTSSSTSNQWLSQAQASHVTHHSRLAHSEKLFVPPVK